MDITLDYLGMLTVCSDGFARRALWQDGLGNDFAIIERLLLNVRFLPDYRYTVTSHLVKKCNTNVDQDMALAMVLGIS